MVTPRTRLSQCGADVTITSSSNSNDVIERGSDASKPENVHRKSGLSLVDELRMNLAGKLSSDVKPEAVMIEPRARRHTPAVMTSQTDSSDEDYLEPRSPTTSASISEATDSGGSVHTGSGIADDVRVQHPSVPLVAKS